jgi:octanoyl-[GcvH]:protein N-octanoyltransferase
VQLVLDSFPERPAFDMAVTHALLLRVGRAELPATLRLARPGPTVAFGRLDALRPGFAAARDAARRHGFTPVLRLGGGHAAAYDEGSLLVEKVTPAAAVAQGIQARFAEETERLRSAIAGLGVDARIGQLPGEYCPGSWSINIGGRVKVGGTAQRVVRGAALLGAVVVVTGTERLRDVLIDVYDALELDWDPATLGGVADAQPAADVERVREALRDGSVTGLDARTTALASELESRHALG